MTCLWNSRTLFCKKSGSRHPHFPLADVDGDEGPAVPDAVDASAQNFRRQLEEVAAEDLESAVGSLEIKSIICYEETFLSILKINKMDQV